MSSQASSAAETTAFASTTDNLVGAMDSSANPSANQGVVDTSDEIEVVTTVKGVGLQVRKKPKSEKWSCEGVLISFPEGTNQHTSYPFGIHSEHAVPWNY